MTDTSRYKIANLTWGGYFRSIFFSMDMIISFIYALFGVVVSIISIFVHIPMIKSARVIKFFPFDEMPVPILILTIVMFIYLLVSNGQKIINVYIDKKLNALQDDQTKSNAAKILIDERMKNDTNGR